MTITVLVDNNTYIDQYFRGEPAFCCWLEDEDRRILFDTGYSDLLLQNAAAMGIDLSTATQVVLSHGHNDHTGGLRPLLAAGWLKNAEVIAHPDCFFPKRADGLDIGCPVTAEELERGGARLTLTDRPLAISRHAVFLGEIPRETPFEGQSIGERRTAAGWQPDPLTEDTALALRTPKGIFVLTGCSHSGICNIVAQARRVTGEPVCGILGGFHLLTEDETLRRLGKTQYTLLVWGWAILLFGLRGHLLRLWDGGLHSLTGGELLLAVAANLLAAALVFFTGRAVLRRREQKKEE